MKRLEFERIEWYFNRGPSPHAAHGVLSGNGKRLRLFRNKERRLFVEAEQDGWGQHSPTISVPGSFIDREENSLVTLPFSGTALVKGLISLGVKTSGKSGELKTVERFSVHKIDFSFENNKGDATYLIEWIDNLPSGHLWPHRVQTEYRKDVERVIKWDSDTLTLSSMSQKSGSAWSALHVRLCGMEINIVYNGVSKGKNRRSGFVVYQECPDEALREKVRNVVAFVFGRPIIYLGYSVYNSDWFPLRATGVSGSSMSRNILKMHTLPPFPVHRDGRTNMIDAQRFQDVCAALLNVYDQIEFQFFSWAYWHAISSPYHIEAAHLGSLIENLQAKNLTETVTKVDRNVIPKQDWKATHEKFLAMIQDMPIGDEQKKILKDNVGRVNNAPQKLIMKELMHAMHLKLGELELEAWNQRNDAAHGNVSKDYKRILLNGKVLRMLLHRLIAGITKCSDKYIDYYSLHFPQRCIRDGVERRDDHPPKRGRGRHVPSQQ